MYYVCHMDKTFKILGSIFFAIGSLIGLIFLVSLVYGYSFVRSGGAQKMMGAALGPLGASAVNSDLSSGSLEMPPELKACLVKSLGAQRADELAAGATPTDEEIQKVDKECPPPASTTPTP